MKGLDKLYMAEQLRRHPMPTTSAIRVDEIAIRKGHDYHVVGISAACGCAGIRVAVRTCRPFRQATHAHVPQAEKVFDKVHILCHPNDALDEIRREYARVQGKHAASSFQPRWLCAGCGIKRHRYTLLAHRENLDLDGRNTLKILCHPQTAQHGLCAQGIVRATVELQQRSMGQEVFRPLAAPASSGKG